MQLQTSFCESDATGGAYRCTVQEAQHEHCPIRCEPMIIFKKALDDENLRNTICYNMLVAFYTVIFIFFFSTIPLFHREVGNINSSKKE